MRYSKVTHYLLLIFFLVLAFFPDFAEARRGRGGAGGTLWWIPVVIVGVFVAFVNKNIPRLWEYILGLAFLVFVSLFGAIGLKEIGIIERESIFITSVFIFIFILFAPPYYLKIKSRINNGKEKN